MHVKDASDNVWEAEKLFISSNLLIWELFGVMNGLIHFDLFLMGKIDAAFAEFRF